VNVGDVQERLVRISGCVVCKDDRPQTIAAGLTEVLSQKMPFRGRDAVKELDEDIVAKRIINIYRRTGGEMVATMGW
jgi:hypothetical protein